MICPKCGTDLPAQVNFCQNCGYQFSQAAQNAQPIRVVIPPAQDTQTPIVSSQAASPSPPAAVPVQVRTERRVPVGCLVFSTIVVTLFVLGAIGVTTLYFYWSSSQREEARAANTNINQNENLNTAPAAPKPSPTTYEDLKNKIAPPDKRTQLIDETFDVAPGEHRAVPFSINESSGSKLAGGLRVTKGKNVNFYVYPAAAYAEYPTNGLKPIHLEQIRSKIINQKLTPGDYYLVFENKDNAQAISVASEIYLVNN